MPLMIVLVVVIIVVVGARIMGKRNRAATEPVQDDSAPSKPLRRNKAREISREDAVEAGARLTPESHQLVYSLIAQRQILNAVKEYRRATRMGLGDSAAAVAALAQFPQPTPEPVRPTPEPVQPIANEAALTVEDIIKAAPETESKPVGVPNAYRYRAIVSQGEEIREVASTRLNEEIFRHIRELAQSGDPASAARVLCDHADIGEAEAKEFVSMIGPEER